MRRLTPLALTVAAFAAGELPSVLASSFATESDTASSSFIRQTAARQRRRADAHDTKNMSRRRVQATELQTPDFDSPALLSSSSEGTAMPATAAAGDAAEAAAPPPPSPTVNYNKRIEPCPGFEGLRGYASVASLREDLADYFIDSFSAAAAATEAPVAKAETAAPSESPSSSLSPTYTLTPTTKTNGPPSASPSPSAPSVQSPSETPSHSTDPSTSNNSNSNSSSISQAQIPSSSLAPSVMPSLEPSGLTPAENNTGGLVRKRTRNSHINDRGGKPSSSRRLSERNLQGGMMLDLISSHNGKEKEDLPVILFPLCPNSLFDFKIKLTINSSEDSKVAFSGVTTPPIILETPSIHRPIEISCMMGKTSEGDSSSSRSCVFNDGGVHILIRHNYTYTEYGNEQEGGDAKGTIRTHGHDPITLSGITFRNARESSILMQDPRGEVTFQNCAWEDNEGVAAIMINGRYDAAEHEDYTIPVNGTGSTNDDFNNLNGTTLMSLYLSNNETKANASAAAPGFDGLGGHDLLSNRVQAAQKSIISIDKCSFAGNKGNATIMVWSHYSDELSASGESDISNHSTQNNNTGDGQSRQREGNSIAVHSIHMLIKDTAFQMESVNTSVIGNVGGRLQVSGCSFIQNTAESIIRSKHGIVAMTETSFAMNELRSHDEGTGLLGSLVALDSETVLEANEDTCVGATTSDGGDASEEADAVSQVENDNNGLDLFNNARQRKMQVGNDAVPVEEKNSIRPAEPPLLNLSTGKVGGIDAHGDATSAPDSLSLGSITEESNAVGTIGALALTRNNLCQGISSGGVCTSFKLCATSTTAIEEISPEVEEESKTCFNNWNDLVVAVRNQPQNGQNDFIICSGATLLATNEPVIINTENITIQCGEDESKNCIISGGSSHFQIIGSSKGVRLTRLIMKSSTGVSIMASGTIDATLYLTECEWVGNEGTSAVLIRNTDSEGDEGLKTNDSGTLGKTSDGIELNTISMMKSNSRAAMTVEIASSTFRENTLTFGAIANIGGTLAVFKSKFAGNSGMGGDISCTNAGSCAVEGSCFDASASVTPGVIFVDKSSVMNENVDNFGFGVTAGTYDAADSNEGNISDTCTDIFQETDVGEEGGDQVNGCLSSTTCIGSCFKFTASICGVDGVQFDDESTPIVVNNKGDGAEQLQPSAAPSPSGLIYIPAYRSSNDGSKSSEDVAAIVMAALVSVFILLGFCGIISRPPPSTKNRKRPPSSDGTGGICCCCKKGTGGESTSSTDIEI